MIRGRVNSTSEYAEEGTLAHGLGEFVLKHPTIDTTYDALKAGFKFDVADKDAEPDYRVPDEEMCHHVQAYVDRCLDFAGDRVIEPRVSFEPWVPGWGYIDYLCINHVTRKMVIRDLKYGMGNQVDAVENEQLLLYAIGAVEEFGMLYEIDQIIMEIDQPRLDHVSSWQISYDELMRRAIWFREKAQEALQHDAPLTPGDKQCLWCSAKAECKALADLTYQTVAGEFDVVGELTTKDLNTLTPESKAHILKHKKLIASFLDAVETSALDDVLHGREIPGYKVVAGRSTRQWGDNDEVVADELREYMADDEIYTMKIVSPAQAEKVVGKKAFVELEHLVVKPEGKPTLVPDDDKRPSLTNMIDEF